MESRLRIKIHQEYWTAMLFRDLIERHDISHPKAVTDLAHWLADNCGSLYSVNNLAGYLKSLGHKVPKSAVSDYLEWFEDGYIFFTLRIYDASLSRANANPKKIYCIDHGLVRSIGLGILRNSGHLLENLVFVGLRRITSDIFYYRTAQGREVDFVIRDKDRSLQLFQVCESLADPLTRKRETTGLGQAMAELGLKESTIVSREEESEIVLEAGLAHVVPIWRFLLTLSP